MVKFPGFWILRTNFFPNIVFQNAQQHQYQYRDCPPILPIPPLFTLPLTTFNTRTSVSRYWGIASLLASAASHYGMPGAATAGMTEANDGRKGPTDVQARAKPLVPLQTTTQTHDARPPHPSPHHHTIRGPTGITSTHLQMRDKSRHATRFPRRPVIPTQ